MAFGTELSDFAKAFAATSGQMASNRPPPHYVSASEVEERKARARNLEEATRASQTANTPQKAQADLEATQAGAELNRQQAEKFRLGNTPEAQKLANDNLAAQTKLVMSQAGLNEGNLQRLKDPEFRQAELDDIKATYGLKAAQSAALWAQAADMTDPELRAAKLEGLQAESAGRRAAAGVDVETAREKKWQNDMDAAAYGGGGGGLTVEDAQGAVPAAPAATSPSAAPAPTQDTGTAVSPRAAIDLTASPKLAAAMTPYKEMEPIAAAYGYKPVAAVGQTVGTETSAPAASTRSSGQALTDSQKQAVNDAAATLQVNPSALLAVMSYETGGKFDPNIKGGKGGNYQGLIQFGPAERKAYGFREGMSFEEQVRGPVVNYLKDRGLPPNASVAQLYSVINAGSLDKNGQPRWGASDGNNNIAGHVQQIMAQHMPKAEGMLGGSAPGAAYASAQPAVGGDELDRTGTGIQIAIATGPQRSPAITAGLDHINQMASLDPGALPQADSDRQNRQRAVLEGAGAASNQEVAEVKQVLNDQLGPAATPGQENYRAMDALYQHYMRRGEPEKAKNAAASMLQWMRVAKDRYLAFSKAEAMHGDLDRSTRDLIATYAHTPDNNDMTITKDPKTGHFIIDVTDANGKPVHREVLSPEEYVQKLMKLNPETDVWGMLYQKAGQEDPRPSGAYSTAMQDVGNAPMSAIPEMGAKEQPLFLSARKQAFAEAKDARARAQGPSFTDRDTITNAVAAAQTNWLTAVGGAESETAKAYAPLMQTLVVPAVTAITELRKVGADEAFDAVTKMLTVDPADPEGIVFKAEPDADGMKVTIPGRVRPVVMPKEVYDALLVQRADETAELAAKAGKELAYQTEQQRLQAEQAAIAKSSGRPSSTVPGVPTARGPSPAMSGDMPALPLGLQKWLENPDEFSLTPPAGYRGRQ